jgi:type II secretory pathway pseudopilin PulG
MKNIKTQNNKKAFTLIEALVAISILMIAIASPMTLAQKGLSTAVLSKDQMIAAFLAQDAIEAVKNIRDQVAVSQTSGDWLTGDGSQFLQKCICDSTSFDCSFDVKPPAFPFFCQIDSTASVWNSAITAGGTLSPKLKISYTNPDVNGIKHFLKYDYVGTNCDDSNNSYVCNSKFSRYINIIKTSDNEAVVNVRVFWDSPQGIQKIDVQNFIYNYSENL